jgi:hypothetical protein
VSSKSLKAGNVGHAFFFRRPVSSSEQFAAIAIAASVVSLNETSPNGDTIYSFRIPTSLGVWIVSVTPGTFE